MDSTTTQKSPDQLDETLKKSSKRQSIRRKLREAKRTPCLLMEEMMINKDSFKAAAKTLNICQADFYKILGPLTYRPIIIQSECFCQWFSTKLVGT